MGSNSNLTLKDLTKKIVSLSRHKYIQDKEWCQFAYYIKRTVSLVPPTENSLFITHGKPYKKPSKDTVHRWISDILNCAGINTSRYKVHNTRNASSSKSLSQGSLSLSHYHIINVQSILSKGGSKSENVFSKYYQLLIMTTDTPVMVATLFERNDISENFHDHI